MTAALLIRFWDAVQAVAQRFRASDAAIDRYAGRKAAWLRARKGAR